MARRAAAEMSMPGTGPRAARGPKILFWSVSALVAATFAVFAGMSVEEFLISDPRFLLPRPIAPSVPNQNFEVSGIFYASHAQVQQVFARDFGRSIYLCPIAERRRMLLAVDWVEDATVSRIWPNRLAVTIRERKPVAFAQVETRDGSMMSRLIDGHGVLLDLQRPVKLKLPVLAGLRTSDTEEKRRARVERLLEVQKELGPLMDKVSEIDISDLNNVRITQPVEGRVLTLLLGDRDYRKRIDGLLASYGEIGKRLPNAHVLDLRVPNRIVAAEDPGVSGGGTNVGKP